MLYKLKMKISTEGDKRLSYQMSSVMHGVLMEKLEPGYADFLHGQNLRPYSQNMSFENENVFWNINALNQDAYENIIQTLIKDDFNSIYLKRHSCKVLIEQKQLFRLTDKEITEKFYFENSDNYFKVKFCSPTAFKQNGKYTFYPDLTCIYQSLMKRYDYANEKESFFDSDLLEQLVKDSQIVQYNLKSMSFPLEGVRIPAFMGWVLIKTTGTQTMSNYVNMLLHFGEYSGIGIKTSLGMGAIKLMEKEER